jgi:hypothetical protein
MQARMADKSQIIRVFFSADILNLNLLVPLLQGIF